MTPSQLALLGLASAAAGAINAVAGGGTLLTFPALLGVGIPSISANATNTAGLAPAAFVGAWSFRDRLDENGRKLLLPLGLLGFAGALIGAGLLLITPVRLFDRLVPFLILAATLLFAFPPKALTPRPPLPTSFVPQASMGKGETEGITTSSSPLPERRDEGETLGEGQGVRASGYILLFIVAIYGGYFGAGIGILTLAALQILGFHDVGRANAVKAVFTGGVNGVAAILFAIRGLVFWKEALLVCACGMVGAWGGAGIAKKLGSQNVKKLVILIGVGLTLQTLWKFWIQPK
ncbi:MAG: sulfite exporter TauE/SafE family protein [Armatimonas sp.]